MSNIKTKCALGAIILCLSSAVGAEERGRPGGAGAPPLSIQVLSKMGRSGLLAMMASNERYGTLVNRVASGRAMATLASIPGNPSTGYGDNYTDLLTPISALVSLNRGPSNTASYLRFASTNRWTDAKETDNGGTKLEADSEAHGLSAQYLFAPNADLMLGVGIIRNQNKVDIKHNDGSSTIDFTAIRADLLKVVDEHWGVALRAVWFDEEANASIPLSFATLNTNQSGDRVYLQADAIGTYGKADLGFLPEGWNLRTNIGAAWQKTNFDKTTNSLGKPVIGPGGNSSDEYGSVYAKVALAKAGRGPVLPYIGLGIDHTFVNTYESFMDEDTYLNSFAGVTVRLSKSAMLNFAYGRYDGFNGNSKKQSFVAAFSMTF